MFGDAMVDVRHLAVEVKYTSVSHFLVFKIFFRSAWMLSLQPVFCTSQSPSWNINEVSNKIENYCHGMEDPI
jgi:hypothetical protein